MATKHAHPMVDHGPVTSGKGLDSLEGFIIHNWAPPTRFGVWGRQTAALSAPKVALARFLDDALHAAWQADGSGAVITIDPPGEPFVTLRVESEHKVWTPDSKYNPKHWLWKVVPLAKVRGQLEETLGAVPALEAGYLKGLLEGQG